MKLKNLFNRGQKRSLRNDQFTREIMRACVCYSHLVYRSFEGNIPVGAVYKDTLNVINCLGCDIKTLQPELKEEVKKLVNEGRIAWKYNHNLDLVYKRLNI